jgi:prephenate dehydrogenase
MITRPASTPAPQPSLLLVGFGAFGRLCARLLAPHLRLAVCDPDPQAGALARQMGLALAAPEAAGDFDFVLLAVPVPALEPSLRRIAPHLRAGQMVLDVCSVKEGPAALMLRLLPESVHLLATHPMFGPQSCTGAPAGGRVVLCPLRGEWRRVAGFLRRLGLRPILSTPQDHDRHAAMTQGLTHLLARAMAGFDPHPAIRTRSFDLLMQALAMVGQDAPEVYEAVTRGNAHVAPLRERLMRNLAQG